MRITMSNTNERHENYLPTAGHTGPRSDWPFLRIEDAMTDTVRSEGLLNFLDASDKRAFKIWYLSWPLKICAVLLGLTALAVFFWACWQWSRTRLAG